jgi:Type IX secretion system membrane protein PorP/SprF
MNSTSARLFFIVSVFVMLFTTKSTFAQQDAQFSHYMFNGMYLNPGFAGIEGVTKVTGMLTVRLRVRSLHFLPLYLF